MEKSNRDADQKLLDKIKAFGSAVKNALVQAQILTRSIPVIIEQPVSVKAAENTSSFFQVTAENITSYQWQSMKKTGGDWNNVSLTGNNTNKITFSVIPARTVFWYRCKLTGINGDIIYTDSVDMTIIGG